MTAWKPEPSDDPVWVDRARLLLEFLQEPRDWEQLSEWARRYGLTQSGLRHTIAYANKLISYQKGEWRSLVKIPQPNANG